MAPIVIVIEVLEKHVNLLVDEESAFAPQARLELARADLVARIAPDGCDTTGMMARPLLDSGARHDHWDAAYRRVPPTELSWHQADPDMSLELIDTLAIPHTAAVIDVGGGASTLVDHLLSRGFRDVSVLDVSEAALAVARERLPEPELGHWFEADVTFWTPSRRYDLWHDRAVFHFLVDAEDRKRYLSVLRSAIQPGAHAIIATFAPDGPERCSGLPVARYGPEDLAQLLDGAFDVVAVRHEKHITPAGKAQPFTWVAARRSAA